jgi:hypothetical protein
MYLPANRPLEHPAKGHSIDDSGVRAKPDDHARVLSITTKPNALSVSRTCTRNKSTLHRLSFMWPRNVNQDGPRDSRTGRKCRARMRLTTSLSTSTPKANAICYAILGHPQEGLRRFIWMKASMSS